MSTQPRPHRAWPRSQQFVLSETGRQAALAYQEQLHTSQAQQGRASFEAARAAWSATHGVQPDDALYLSELVTGSRKLEHLVEALRDCGHTRADAVDALGRLMDAGLALSQMPAAT